MATWPKRCLPAMVVATALLAHATAATAAAPVVAGAWVTDVTASSADLRAELNAGGLPTHYRFQYVTEAEYEQSGFAGAGQLPASGEAYAGAGAVAVEVIQHLGGLTSSTAYRYRIVATSTAGTTIGSAHPLGTEESAPVFRLPDARAWELVSPVDKGGGAVGAPGATFGGGDFQAAAQGGAIAYSAATAFAGPPGAPPVSEYLSTRSPQGWTTADLSPPLQSGSYGDRPDGAPFRLFSTDLSSALLLDPSRCAVDGTCPPSYSLWREGSFTALLAAPALRFGGASPDLRHVIFAAAGGLYEWSGGALTQLSSDPEARLAASIGAVSEDGSRVYFSVGEDGPLYLREGAATRLVPETAAGGASFQAASADGSVAYFTAGGRLYRYLASTAAVTDITPTGDVAGVLGISADGSRAFYQDGSGLWRWEDGATVAVAPGGAASLPADYPPSTGTARVSADGAHLAFISKAQLTAYENAGHAEAYVWGPPPGGGAARLVCASCDPTGERPAGEAGLPGAPPNGTSPLPYKSRALAADGGRLFFESEDSLVLQDTDGAPDVYEWEAQGEGDCAGAGGCIGLISSGRDPEGASFLDASAAAADVYFLTAASLVAADPGSIDVYDARVGGGLAESIRPLECDGDACQPLPAEPEDPNPTTLLQGAGNPPLVLPKRQKASKRKRHRKGRHGRHKKGRHKAHRHRRRGRAHR